MSASGKREREDDAGDKDPKQARKAGPLPPLSPAEELVVEDILRLFQDFGDQPNMEFEARVGVIVDKTTDKRIEVQGNDPVIVDSGDYQFNGDLGVEKFKFLNKKLNGRVQFAKENPKAQQYRYRHPKPDRDLQFPCRTRVTVDPDGKTNIINKVKLSHLDFAVPGSHLDIRVSVNAEIPKDEHPDGRPRQMRIKDRLSYSTPSRFPSRSKTSPFWSLDLTQVKTYKGRDFDENTATPGPKATSVAYEMEIECISIPEMQEYFQNQEDDKLKEAITDMYHHLISLTLPKV